MEEEIIINNNNEVSFLKALFRKEITWIITIGTVIWAFVGTVVLPINNLQAQVAQIQTQLTMEQSKYDALNKDIQDTNKIANKALVEIESHLSNN